MNNRLLIAAFVSICFLSGSCKISSGQGSRYDFSSLDSVIQGWVDKGYYPGASICVVKNDTVIFQKNYRDYTPDTKVYVASAVKTMLKVRFFSGNYYPIHQEYVHIFPSPV